MSNEVKRIVTYETTTGSVVAEWQGGQDQVLPEPPTGLARREVAPDGDKSYTGLRWNGTDFVPVTPAPVRRISRADFMRLFTQAERIAIHDRQTAAGDAAGKVLADFFRLLELSGDVRLDHADTSAGLAYLVSLGLLTQARRAAILANQSPTA